VQGEKGLADGEAGKVDEENFVEAAFAKHFGGKRRNVVGSGGEKNAGFAVLHPGKKRGEETLREACVGIAGCAAGCECFFDFVDPEDDGRHFLREFETFTEFLFAFANEFVIERTSVEAGEFESPLARDGFCGETFAATLHAGYQNSFWWNEAELYSFGGESGFSFGEPIFHTSEAGDVGKRRIAANGFKEAFTAQDVALGFEKIFDDGRVGFAAGENAHTECAKGFFFGKAGKGLGGLLHAHGVEGNGNVIVAIEIGESLADAGEKFFECREAEFEGNGIACEIGRKANARAGNDDGAACGAEIFTEFAEAAADFVVVAVAGEVLEKKDGFTVDDGNVGEGLNRIVGVVERFAFEAGETFGDAPVVDGNIEFGGDLKEELFDALFFSGFDGDDGMVGVDEEAKFVTFIKFGGGGSHEERLITSTFCLALNKRGLALRAAPLQRKRISSGRGVNRLFDFTGSVP